MNALGPWTSAYHGNLKSTDVKGVNFPIAANVVNELNQPMDPENPCDHQDGQEEAISLDPIIKINLEVGKSNYCLKITIVLCKRIKAFSFTTTVQTTLGLMQRHHRTLRYIFKL